MHYLFRPRNVAFQERYNPFYMLLPYVFAPALSAQLFQTAKIYMHIIFTYSVT